MTSKRVKGNLVCDLSSKPMRDAAAALSDTAIPDTLEGLSAEFEPYGPVLLQFLQTLKGSAVVPPPSRQASTITKQDVRDLLVVNYEKDSESHTWEISVDKEKSAISSMVDSMITKMKKSTYFNLSHAEGLTRTLVDILVCDRLDALQDAGVDNQLRVFMEVPIFTKMDGPKAKAGGFIHGRADWALGWGSKAEIQHLSLVIEAKTEDNVATGLSQLICYMVGIHDARLKSDKQNCEVFGLVTDSSEFQFYLLDREKKLYSAKPLFWLFEKHIIVAFLDQILRSAIQASPSTTPVKANNTTTSRQQYPLHLRRSFVFGSNPVEESSEAADADSSSEYEYEIIKSEGASFLRRLD